MSKRAAILRRQDQLFTDIAMMQNDLMQHGGCHEDSLVSSVGHVGNPDDYNDVMMNRANRYLLSPPQKMYQMQPPSPPHNPQHSPRQRGRKSQHMPPGLMDPHHHHQQHQSYVAMKPGNMSVQASMLMNDVFGQNPMAHLVMPTSPDMGVGQNMEVGSEAGHNDGQQQQQGEVILVSNMLKSEVIESGEVVVGANMHAQNVGNEIVIDEHAGRLGLGMVGPPGGADDGEYGESALVIDTGAMREEIAPSIGYDCGECGAVMKSRGSLKKHIIKYHAPNPEPEEEVDRIYQCPACPYQTQRRDKLDKHMGKHLAEGLSTTGKKRNKGTLPQRMRHAAEEYKCQLCPYKCTVEKSLRKHNKLHQLGTKQFVVKVSCYVCGKDRSTEADLRKHMKKHRDGKDFQCDICGFASVQLKKIIQHRRMHTGEKPHLCPHCTYRSSRRDNLRSHVRRMHKKENMYIDTFNPRAEQAAEMNTF